MNIPWDDARVFLAVAEQGSLSAAARSLAMTQPTVSRRLAALERALGEALFARGVEGAALTAYGERLLGPARRMAEGAAELARAAEGREVAIEGTVRITAPPGVAFEFVVPFAASLRETLPNVRLDVVATTRYLDLSRREADLAVRLKRPVGRDLTVVATLRDEAVPHVAPVLAARLGADPKPAAVPWIVWSAPHDDMQPNAFLKRRVPGHIAAFASDDFLVQLRAAQAGLGAMMLGRARSRLATDRGLVPIRVQGIPVVPVEVFLVGATRALEIPRVRAVADLLTREFAAMQRAERRRARP